MFHTNEQLAQQVTEIVAYDEGFEPTPELVARALAQLQRRPALAAWLRQRTMVDLEAVLIGEEVEGGRLRQDSVTVPVPESVDRAIEAMFTALRWN